MDINIANLKLELSNLNNLLEEYELNNLNLYNILNSSSLYWVDNNAINFFNSVNQEKVKINLFYTELKSLREIYAYIVNEYQSLGNKIRFDLTKQDDIISYFNKYLNSLNIIINKYDSLDLSFCGREAKILLSQREKLFKMKETTNDLKSDVIKIFNKINEIEKEVNLRISRIKLEVLDETDISVFI